jgi:hypothetical protein
MLKWFNRKTLSSTDFNVNIPMPVKIPTSDELVQMFIDEPWLDTMDFVEKYRTICNHNSEYISTIFYASRKAYRILDDRTKEKRMTLFYTLQADGVYKVLLKKNLAAVEWGEP